MKKRPHLKKFHIAVINTHPIQYFAPLYSYLNKSTLLKITAVYGSEFGLNGGIDKFFGCEVKWDVDLLSGYDYIFVEGASSKKSPNSFFSISNIGVLKIIMNGKFDAIWIHGYNHFYLVLAFCAAKIKGVPIFFRGETHLGLKKSKAKLLVHKMIVKFLFKRIDYFLSIGSANSTYYESMGVPKDKIVLVPYAVDNDRYIESSSISDTEKKKIINSFGLECEKPTVLYAAKFTERKCPEDLIYATKILKDEGYSVSLLMVGAGELESRLKSLVKKLNLHDVVFTGFINQAKLPKIYSSADVFVLPSKQEPWGLAVNEAMCSRLPVIVSSEVGCKDDLVFNGKNGYIVEVNNPKMLAEAIRKILFTKDIVNSMGEESYCIISEWNYLRCRNSLERIIKQINHNKIN